MDWVGSPLSRVEGRPGRRERERGRGGVSEEREREREGETERDVKGGRRGH